MYSGRIRRRGPFIYLLVPLLALSVHAAAQPGPESAVEVTDNGSAPAKLPRAKELAIEDALRACVEHGGGVAVWSASATKDFRLAGDVIYTKTMGYIESYKLLAENPDQDGLYVVRVKAIVKKGAIDADLLAFKALMIRKRRPRLLVVGSADLKPFDPTYAAEVMDVLEEKGFTVVSYDGMTARQNQDAQEAASGKKDPSLAAQIAREVNADYLVLIRSTIIEKGRKEPYPGVVTFPMEGTSIVEIYPPDTNQVLASKREDGYSSEDDPASSRKKLMTDTINRALQKAIPRVAAHWLEDVDQRGGEDITITLVRFSADRRDRVVRTLRGVAGVSEVIVEKFNAEGRSTLRAITHLSAGDLDSRLRSSDPGLHTQEVLPHEVVYQDAAPVVGNKGAVPSSRASAFIVTGALALSAVVMAVVAWVRCRAEHLFGGGSPAPEPQPQVGAGPN